MAGLGRKLFTRETLSSAEVQGYLMDQAVMRFPSAATNAAQNPSPSQGMVAYLDDADKWYGRVGVGSGFWRPLDGNWGTITGTALPGITAGVKPGDRAYIDLWRCEAQFLGPDPDDDTVGANGAWRQLNVTTVPDSLGMTVFLNDLTTAGGSLHNGFLVFNAELDRLYVGTGGTALRPVDGAWGPITGATLPTLADAKYNPGDTAYIDLWRCWAVLVGPDSDDPTIGAAGSWRQITVTQVANEAGMTSFLASLTAAGMTMHNGFQVFDNGRDRMFSCAGGTTMVAIGGSPGSTVTTGFTAAGNWTIASAGVRNLGNGMAQVYVVCTRATAGLALPADNSGDITNGPIATLPTGWGPLTGVNATMTSGPGGRVANGWLADNRELTVAAVGGTSTIAVGDQLSLGGIYPLANPLAN